jgi:hypothetical protein
VIGEEGEQRFRRIGIVVEQALSIRFLAGIDGGEVGRDDFIQAQVVQ